MASWREHYTYKQYLFLLIPMTIFAARVNQASITYPLAQVTYDTVTTGAYTDIEDGMTIAFGSAAGLSDLGRGRVRKTPTSTILYIGWSSQGIHDGECNLADNAYITVWDDHRAWAKIPRLVNFQDQYKDFDLDYTHGQDIPPFANGGPDVMKLVDSAGEITVDFAGTGTVTDPGAAITTHAWDFIDGTPASAATASVNGVVFPYGFRHVKYTVTDDNAKSHTHFVKVAAVATPSDPQSEEISYGGAVITSSSELGVPLYQDGHAFDGDSGTRWLSASNSDWIQIQLTSAPTIISYDLDQTIMGTAACDTAILKGSTNGSDFATIDTRTGLAGAQVVHTFEIQSPGAYSYYRLELTSSGIYVGAWEIDLKVYASNVITNFDVLEQTLTREGQIFRVAIHDDIAESSYPDGTLVMYMEREVYNGVEGSLAGPADREHMKFVGWHATDPAVIEGTETGIITTTEFECHDIGARMRNLPAFSSIVGRIGASTAWYLLPSAHTDRYIHYLLHWHSTVLDVAPFTWSGTGGTYALPWFATTAMNLWEQVNWRTQSIAHALTVSMQGELKMLPDPQLQDSGDRTATVITDIDPQDWGGITYTHQRPPRVYWLWSNAVVASTLYVSQTGLNINAVFCVAPGEAPGQGGIDQTQGEQLVADQDELNAREGHRYAARLNPFQTYFDISLVHGGDVGIDPAVMTWIRATLTSTQAAQRGLTFTDDRFLPWQVTITHNKVGVGNDHTLPVKDVIVSAEREAVGTPAATHIPQTGTTVPITPKPEDWPIVYEEDPAPELHRGAAVIGAFDNTGLLHITNDFSTPEVSNGPTWTTTDLTGLSPALSGDYLQMVGDPFSPKYIGSGSTVNGWILTSTGIYSITDVFGVSSGPTLALQHTLATADADWGFIASGVGLQNWAAAIVHYSGSSTGTKVIYTTDGGSSWAEVTITSHYDTTPGNVAYFPFIWMSPFTAGLAYAGALTTTSAEPLGGLYKTTDYGATWAATSSPNVDFDDHIGSSFHIPMHDNGGQVLNYHRSWDAPTDTAKLNRTESDGTTITDITPTGDFAPRFWWSLSVCSIDRQRIAMAGRAEDTPDQLAIWVSKDAGDTWTQVTATVNFGSGGYIGVGVAGNDPDVIYAWGYDLQIAYTQDFGVTWQDKTTKLAGSATIINILGG